MAMTTFVCSPEVSLLEIRNIKRHFAAGTGQADRIARWVINLAKTRARARWNMKDPKIRLRAVLDDRIVFEATPEGG